MTQTNRRDYGIDFLRILSMLLITLAHIQGHGGILTAATGAARYFVYLPETLAICAVNCYGLISGYVAGESRWRPSSLMVLWCQVAFYSVGLTVVGGLLNPGSVGWTDIAHSFLPVTFQGGDYWYFNAYVGLFFMMPVLNYVVRTLPPRRLLAASVILAVGFGLFPTLIRHDPFYLREGYSALWLMVLYVVGGCCKRCRLLAGWSNKKLALLLAGATLVTYAQRLAREFLEENVGLYAKISERFFEADADWRTFISPTMLLEGIALLLLCARLKPGPWGCKVIGKIAPLCFSVYLIQNHPQVLDLFMRNRFAGYVTLPVPLLALAIFGTTAAIFIVCVMIDALRARLFRLARIKPLCVKLEDGMRRGFGKLLDAIERQA